jgi:hypothetical protein
VDLGSFNGIVTVAGIEFDGTGEVGQRVVIAPISR